jgi:hypothetical protein
MSSASGATLRSLNCTQCGAPLSLHGGHKVQSLTCGYCGSVLDAHDDFKVVKTYKDLRRPRCPIKIGMSGRIKDVDFVAIGMVQYRDEEFSSWLEIALFSPTHGYAWLEYDHGHFVFSRRTREMPEFEGHLHHQSPFLACGYLFYTHSIYTATVTFVEGELTYVAAIGDRVRLTEGIAPPLGYTIEDTADEQEYQLSEYLQPRAVYDAFGLDSEEARDVSGVHPIQPYTPSGLTSGLRLAGMCFAPLALVLLLYTLFFGSGSVILNQSINAAQLYGKQGAPSKNFTVRDAQNLISLDLSSNFKNAWGFFDVVVTKDNEPVFSMGKQISYYSGYSGGESWSEGSTSAHAYFKVPTAGTYTLRFYGQGGVGNTGRKPQQVPLRVKVAEGVKISRYYFVLLCLSLGAWAMGWLTKRRFEAARWEDEDDDDD